MALRSTNASMTRESSVFILKEHTPRTNSGMRGDDRCDRRHQALHRPVARYELGPERFGELRDVSVCDSQPERARARYERAIEQLEQATPRGVTAAHATHRFDLSFLSKRHHGLQIELGAQPCPAAPQPPGAHETLEIVDREEPARLGPYPLELAYNCLPFPPCCSKLYATYHKQALAQGGAAAVDHGHP